MIGWWIGACVGVLEEHTCSSRGNIDVPEPLLFAASFVAAVLGYLLLARVSDALRARRLDRERLHYSAVRLARRERR